MSQPRGVFWWFGTAGSDVWWVLWCCAGLYRSLEGYLDDGVLQCMVLGSQKPERVVLDDLQEQTLLAQMVC